MTAARSATTGRDGTGRSGAVAGPAPAGGLDAAAGSGGAGQGDMAAGSGRGDPHAVAATVVDPELRVVTIEDLGILREVRVESDRVVVTITPTYSGCPAMDVIRADLRRALAGAGWPEVEVVTRLQTAWSTDDISAAGLAKLAATGIAPPGPAPAGTAGWSGPAVAGRRHGGPVPLTLAVRCPLCGSPRTEQIARFGATACKALWRCHGCGEPFEHFKPL